MHSPRHEKSKCLYERITPSVQVFHKENPEIWGNEDGWYMFSSINAFGKGAGDVLSHDDIIVFLRRVYEPAICALLSLIPLGNASNASINVLKLLVLISFFISSLIFTSPFFL
jgi:hypothetical protein